MADQYLFAKPQKRKEEDEIVNPFAGNNMPELGKQNIVNPFDSPDSIEEQAPPVNIFEGAEKSAEPSLDERTDSEFYEWFNYNMANPDFAPTDSQYDRFNKIRINKGIKLGKVFDAATEVPAMLWDEMVKRPGKSQVVEMARRYQKSYSNKLRGSASANEKAMKDFGLNYDDSQRIKNPLDRRRPINLGLSMGPIRPSNDSIQKVRDQLKEAWINHNYKIFNTATEGAELIASIQGLSKDEKAGQEKTIEFLMREKVNSVNSIYRQNLKNILPERLHKKIDSMSDKQLKGLLDGSKVEPPNRALFFGKEFLTYGLRGIPSSAEGVARATADLGVLGTQLRHYLNDKISPDDVEGQRERLKLHRQILMDRMAKHQGESTYIGDTLRAARMDSVADWFDRSIDPATAEMMSYMVGPEAAAGSLVKAPVKAGAKSATAPTRSQMLRDAYTKNIQAPLVKAEKAVGDAITEVLPSAAMKAAGATGGVLGEGAIKVGELPEKIAGKMAFMLTRNADTAADVERIMGKGTYGAGALDIAGGLNLPIPLVGPISVAAGKIKLMGQLGKSLGEGAKAAGRAWNQKSQKQFLARVAFDPKASPALRNFANWASTIDPALGWAANIGNGMGRGALTGGILTLPTKDEAAIGGGLGIGAMLGGGGSFVGLPYASKLRNAEGQAADIKWFGEETEKHGYMTREQYDLLPDKLKLYAADAQMILGDHPEHGFKIILTPDRFTFEKAFKENGGTGIPTDKGVVMPNKRGVGGVAIVNASKKDAVTTLLHEIGGHSVTRGQDMGDLMTALYDNYGAEGIGKMKDEYALKLLAGEKVINNPRISYEDALMSVAKTPSEIDAYIKEKDLSDPSWWAEEVFASHFAKKALEEGGLLGMSKETRMTIATRKALVEKGGAMLQRIGINIRPDGSIPDPTGLFEVSQIKGSPELDLFVRNYLVERANLLHEIRISNKPKARKGAKIAPERLKDHPAIKWDWNEKSGLWETDFATKTDDGVVTLKSNSEVKQTLADRLEASNKLISDQVVERSNPYLAPKDDGSGGIEIRGTKLPPEFYDLPQFTKSTKDHARAVEEAIDGDTTFQGWYNAIGTSRNPDGWARSVQKGLGNMRTRFREWKPLGFQTTKAGHILETVLDVDATLAKASQFQSEGRLDQYFNGSLEVFHRDLANYLENHKSGEPGEKGIGPDKRNFIRAFLGVPGGQNPLGMTMPTGESLIKTFRLDRMGEVNPTNRRGFFFDYMKVKQNFMPAGADKGGAEFMPAGKGDSHALNIIKGIESPEGLPKNPTILNLAKYFQDRFEDPINFKKASPKQNARFEDLVGKEVRHAMEIHPEAKGWYDENLGLAMSVLRELDPDIAKKENDFFFKAFLAVTSDGNKVDPQFKQAWNTYEHWKKTGEISGEFVSGDRVKNIRNNLKRINKVNTKLGSGEKAAEWLTRKGTVKELRESAVKDLGFTAKQAESLGSGENVDAIIPFASIFGPKLGSFFNNLYGDYSTVTMDRWFMRTVGRNTGTQVKEPSKQVVRDAKNRLRLSVDALTAAERKQIGITKSSVAGGKYIDAARKMAVYFTVKKNRDNASTKVNEVRKAANAIVKMQKPLAEAPEGGGHRKWIRDRIGAVQESLKADGIDLENADLQALLWYNEKELYESAGVRGPKGANDYASAAESLYASIRGRPSEGFAGGSGRVGGIGRGKGDSGLDGQSVAFMPAGKGGDIFYSNSSKALESPKVRNSATGPAMLNDIIRQDPAAGQEMKWIDLDRWLMDKKGKVTKEEVQDFIDANQIAVVEKVRGGDESPEIRAAEEAVDDARQAMYDADDRGTYQEARDAEMAFEEAMANLEFVSKDFDPQFGDRVHSLPGAVRGSYRELELMLPTPAKLTDAEANKIALAKYGKNIEDLSYSQLNKIVDRKFESFKDSHFETDENVFAHVRFNERVDADGKRMLFIEEVQSDWAAKGRDVGFNKPYINGDIVGGREESVPAAPFVSKRKGNRFVEDDKWRALAMKRMIRWASDNNFDRVGWITGRDTADRYNLSKFIDRVEYQRLPGEDRTMVSAWDKAGNKVIPDRMVASKDMKRTVGRELAEKIAADKSGSGEFKGLELAVGGEGHKQFYDIDLPNYTGKYVKKWGGKVGMVAIRQEQIKWRGDVYERTTKAHYVDITPEMKADVQQGQAMFMPAGSDADYMRAAEKGDTKGAQLLVDQAAKAAGYGPNAVYHGTTHKFNVFKNDRGNAENDFGVGHYFTTSQDDVSANYAGLGPDLTSRIELRTEALEGEGLGRDAAFSTARSELAGGEARVITAYVKTDNPAVFGKDDRGSEMRFESQPIYDEAAIADKMPELRQEIAKEEGVKPNEVEEFEVRQRAEEWADDNGFYNEDPHPLLEAVERVSSDLYDVKGIDRLQEILFEEPTYAQVEDVLRREVFQYATNDTGGLVTGDSVKRVFQELGHDGIIDRRVNEKFGTAREAGMPMEGMREGDTHVIVFDPNQIKSADPITYDDAGNIIPLSERFQSGSDDIRYMPAGEGRAPRRMGSATSRPARTRIPMGAVAKQLRMERDLKELKRN